MTQPNNYSPAERSVWQTLFTRQMALLPGRASRAYMNGILATGFPNSRIPDFERDLNPRLLPATGWRVVAVPGLIGNREFFELMAAHQFPATTWVRRADQLDYIQEPDMFHDTFGHVPVLTNQHFCDFLGALSRIALAHIESDEAIEMISRLYWYTVEFGLIQTAAGLRIYGAGIVSSKGESIYALESAAPNRIGFDLLRVMRARYRIDTYQKTYFVIDDFHQLFAATEPDFTPYYELLRDLPSIGAGAIVAQDQVITRGTGEGWLLDGDV